MGENSGSRVFFSVFFCIRTPRSYVLYIHGLVSGGHKVDPVAWWLKALEQRNVYLCFASTSLGDIAFFSLVFAVGHYYLLQ